MISNKESNFVSAVIYLHRDEKNAVPFFEMLAKILETNFKRSEIICVNDGMSDEYLDKLRSAQGKFENINVTIVNMGYSHGLEAAMNAGIDLSIGDFVFEFDSCYMDFAPDIIMQIYRKSLEGYDIVSAVPPAKNSKFSSKFFYKVYNKFSESDYDLCTDRFSIISRRAVNRVTTYSKTIPYRKAIYTSSGLRVEKFEYIPLENTKGYIYPDIENTNKAIDSLILFTNVAYKVALTFSGIMLLFMMCAAIYTVVAYFGFSKPVDGWAPLMGLISVGFFAVFLLITIMMKYLDVILRLIFKNQKYLVSSVEKL